MNQNYIYSVDKISHFVKVNSLKTFKTQTNFLDKYLTRENLIKKQLLENLTDGFEERNGLMFFDQKVILPQSLYIFAALREHVLALHSCNINLINQTKNLFHITNSSQLIKVAKTISRSCLACALTKFKQDRQQHGSIKLDKANICVQIDFIENMPGVNKYILVLIDVYTRFICTYVMKNKTTSNVVNCLRNYLSHFGIIKYIVSDNYSGFKSKEFNRFLNSLGIIRPESAPYKSRARAHVENANGILERSLRSLLLDNRERWEDLIPIVTYLINHRKFTGSSLSAAQLQYGTAYLRHDFFRPEQQTLFKQALPEKFWENEERYRAIVEKAEEELIKSREISSEKRKERVNKTKKASTLEEGDIIVLKDRRKVIGVSSKLIPAYEKVPYKIIKAGTFNVIVESLLDGTKNMRSNNDAKKLNFNENPTLQSLGCPLEAIEMLNMLTEEDIVEIFEGKTKSANEPVKRVTRQDTRLATQVQLDADKLLEEFELEGDYENLKNQKVVTFDI